MKTHKLKTHPKPFQAVADGLKPFELRVNDRDFRPDDNLLLCEYDPDTGIYTGREISAYTPYILYGGQFGLPSDMCVMTLADVRLIKGDT